MYVLIKYEILTEDSMLLGGDTHDIIAVSEDVSKLEELIPNKELAKKETNYDKDIIYDFTKKWDGQRTFYSIEQVEAV